MIYWPERLPEGANPFKIVVNQIKFTCKCGCGGTGRRAGFRIQWATVGVRLPPSAPPAKRARGISLLIRQQSLNTPEKYH